MIGPPHGGDSILHMVPDDSGRIPLPFLARISSALVVIAGLGMLIPDVSLDGPFADLVVRITDTASWAQMPWLATAALVMIVSRSGISGGRRLAEGLSLALVMSLVLAGNGVLNEDVVKPVFGVARPNIEAWASTGLLGPEFADADDFYAAGTKKERRVLLEELLPASADLEVTDLVRAHWVHEAGYSFPSGHSTTAAAFATVLAGVGLSWMSGWRRVVATMVIPVWAAAVILSRTILEVHTTVDVVAGTLAGALWGLAAYATIQWIVGLFDRKTGATQV